jgi:hypothetical protein
MPGKMKRALKQKGATVGWIYAPGPFYFAFLSAAK